MRAPDRLQRPLDGAEELPPARHLPSETRDQLDGDVEPPRGAPAMGNCVKEMDGRMGTMVSIVGSRILVRGALSPNLLKMEFSP